MPGSILSSEQNAVMATKPPPVAPRSGRGGHWTVASLPDGDEIVHARSGSMDSVESSGSSSCSGGGRPDAVPEYVPARTPYKAPRANTNALQFVKVQSPLYRKAEQQIQLTEEVKFTSGALKEGEEEWQSNLDNWKSRRRKVSEKVIQRAEEMRQIEIEEQIRQEQILQQQRKIKKFSEMVEKRGSTRSYHLELCGGDDSGLGATPEPDDATSESGEEAREREPPRVARKPWATKIGLPDDTPTDDDRKEFSDNAFSADAISSEDDVSFGGPAGNADSGMESLGDFRPSDCASDLSQDSGSDSQEAPLLDSAKGKDSEGVERRCNVVVKVGDNRGLGFSLRGWKDQECAAYVDTNDEKSKPIKKGSSFAERLALFSNGVPPQPKSPITPAKMFEPNETKSESLVLRRRSAFENGPAENSDLKSRRASHIPQTAPTAWTNGHKRHSADCASLPTEPPEGSKRGRPPPVPMKPKLRAMTSPSAELQRNSSIGERAKFVKQETFDLGYDDATEEGIQIATSGKEHAIPSPLPEDDCELPHLPSPGTACELSHLPPLGDVCELSHLPPLGDVCELSHLPPLGDVCELSHLPPPVDVCELRIAPDGVCESPGDDCGLPHLPSSPGTICELSYLPPPVDVCELPPPDDVCESPGDVCELPHLPPSGVVCELAHLPPLVDVCELSDLPPPDNVCELPPLAFPDDVCESPPSSDDSVDHVEEQKLSFTENRIMNSLGNDFAGDQDVPIDNSDICDSKLLDYPKLDFFSTTIEEEFSSPSPQLAEFPANETASALSLDRNPESESCDLYSRAYADALSHLKSEDSIPCQDQPSDLFENETAQYAISSEPTDSVQVTDETNSDETTEIHDIADDDEKPSTPPSANTSRTFSDFIRIPNSNPICEDLVRNLDSIVICEDVPVPQESASVTDDAGDVENVDEHFKSSADLTESSLEKAVDELESLYNLELTNLKNCMKNNVSPLCLPLEKIDEDDVVSASTATSSDSPNTETVIETCLSPLPCDEAPDYSRELDESLDQITALDVIDEMEMRLMRQLEQQGDASFEDVSEDLTERLGEVVDREWLYLTEEAALLGDLAPKNLDPPREPPPPPPPPEMDTQGKNVFEGEAFARANSTKRIRKELWRRRSDFLGLDATDAGLDDIPPPPPGLEEILKQERAQNQWLERRLSLGILSTSSVTPDSRYDFERELNCEEIQGEDYMEILEEEDVFRDSLYSLRCEDEAPSSTREGSPQHKAKQQIQSLGAAPRAKIMDSSTWITHADRDLADHWSERDERWRRPPPTTANCEPVVVCACCGTALSGGAAMGIAALQLCFHLECFRCCACGRALGNGSCGADVQVRDRRLFCPRCFSAC